MPPRKDLIFRHFSEVSYSSGEFQFNARINNLGFRGRDFSIEKSTRYRIVALGDSFTYGWGVNIEDTWLEILQKSLRASGKDVEMANLGKGGGSPIQYADIAEKAIPLLKPDLVIVAVLQGDDLAQIRLAAERRRQNSSAQSQGTRAEGFAGTLKAIVATAYPNLSDLLRGALPPGADEVSLTWRDQAEGIRNSLPEDEMKRFNDIDAEPKNMFLAGKLNPALISYAMKWPYWLRRPLDLLDPENQEAIQELSDYLLRIKAVTEECGGRVFVISVPVGAYVSEAQVKSRERMGFDDDKNSLKTTAMDEATHLAAVKAGIDFFEVTQIFRRESLRRDLYYEFDGHFTPEANRFFAERIEPIVLEYLR
ncbi:MAG: hypothetical protein HY801_16250 [Candidatus Lindowbacteria bacterium]|nr:hypothetical protein [Candidatus Lindowbacteria bacterium]